MALPRADIREARRDARKPPKAPSMTGLAGPAANFNAGVNQYGQITQQAPSAPLGSAVVEGVGGVWAPNQAPAAGATGYVPAAAQGSQFGQQAAIDALNNIRGFTGTGLTDAERGALNAATQRGTAQSQAAIRSLAQQAAARGAADSGGLWAAQGAAAQGGANNAAMMAADAGMAAQDRALGATQTLYGMGQGIDTAASGRGGALDAWNQQQIGNLTGAAQQDYANSMARWQAQQEQRSRMMQSVFGGLSSLGSTAAGLGSTTWGGG